MKRVIDIDEETYNYAKNEPPIICGMNDGLIYQSNMKEAIAQSIPYNPSDDLIDREAFRKHYCKINCGERQCVDHADRCLFIDELMQFKTEPEPPFKPVAEIKVTLTEEEKQKFIEELQKQRLVCALPETPMELVAGKCPIDANGDCPLRSKGRYIDLDLAKKVIAKFEGYLDEDMIERIQIALEKECEVANGSSN